MRAPAGQLMIQRLTGQVCPRHGELYAFGAYMMYMWVMVLGANFYLALPLAVLLGAALGAAIEVLLLRRLRDADIDTTMLVMIGAWIALQNSEQLAWSGVAARGAVAGGMVWVNVMVVSCDAPGCTWCPDALYCMAIRTFGVLGRGAMPRVRLFLPKN